MKEKKNTGSFNLFAAELHWSILKTDCAAVWFLIHLRNRGEMSRDIPLLAHTRFSLKGVSLKLLLWHLEGIQGHSTLLVKLTEPLEVGEAC